MIIYIEKENIRKFNNLPIEVRTDIATILEFGSTLEEAMILWLSLGDEKTLTIKREIMRRFWK